MNDSPPPPATGPSAFLERWGPAWVVTILALFAVEMAVFGSMVRYGLDLSALVGWINATFDTELAVATGQPSWGVSLAMAYAITRPLKPIQLGVATVVTPVVGRFVGVPKVDGPTTGA